MVTRYNYACIQVGDIQRHDVGVCALFQVFGIIIMIFSYLLHGDIIHVHVHVYTLYTAARERHTSCILSTCINI